MKYELLSVFLAIFSCGSAVAHGFVSQQKLKAYRAWPDWDVQHVSREYCVLRRLQSREHALSVCVAVSFVLSYLLALLNQDGVIPGAEHWIMHYSFYASVIAVIGFLFTKMTNAHIEQQFWNRK